MTDADPGTPVGGLTRITFNATACAVAALTAIGSANGDNRTDAINGSLRVCATLLALAHPDGTVHVLAPDGSSHVVHLP